MNQERILFIINLLSGRERKRNVLISNIKILFPKATIFIIHHTPAFADALNLAQNEKYQYIIINGGDGTINSFLSILVEQRKILGILPSGSGNGLARTLNIPLRLKEALKIITKQNIEKIDIGQLQFIPIEHTLKDNMNYFACAVGFGIDAQMAHTFESQKIRGLLGYIIAGIKKISQYNPVHAQLSIDHTSIPKNSYTILSVMNIPQYGNNFYLSPSACSNDGLLNVVMLQKTHWLFYPYILLNLIQKKEKLPLKYYKGKQITIELLNHTKEIICHIDGEPRITNKKNTFEITILPKALQVLK